VRSIGHCCCCAGKGILFWWNKMVCLQKLQYCSWAIQTVFYTSCCQTVRYFHQGSYYYYYYVTRSLPRGLYTNALAQFMELEQKKTESESNTDTLQHYLKCTFLQSIIIANEARREKGSAKKVYIYMYTAPLLFRPQILTPYRETITEKQVKL
jgi:hypothetical protein